MKRTAIILAISASTIDASSPSIRGGGSNNNNKRIISHNNSNNRPAIRDERQTDKIRRYNRQRKLSDGVASMMSHQYAGTSGIHVKVQQGEDELGFQTPPVQTVADDNGNNNSGVTTSSSSEMPLPQYQTVHQNQYYYPSFDMDLYPNGACLNDGHHPTSYSLTPSQFLFDSRMDCCEEWFVDVKSCLSVGNDDVEEAMMIPTSFPTWDNESGGGSSPWPTWSDDVFQDDDKTATTTADDDSTETTSTSSATEAASTTSTGGIGASTSTTTEDTVESIDTDDVFNYFVDNDNTQGSSFQGSDNSGINTNSQQDQNQASSNTSSGGDGTSSHYTFYESFENGDFHSHPWKLTSSSPSSNIAVDPWSAERTAIAYQGRYAARPGILSTPSTVTNLTISLNDLNDDGSPDHGVFTGGLLRFAIHAAVDLPIDALYFSINDHVIREFTSPTGYEEGDWEEVSTLLLPGEHTLSWSYQFYGGGNDTVDPRRVGNSWIDDIELIPYTGDYALREGQTDVLDMTSGVSPWNVVHDPNAFDGDKSFIAYTQDIVSNQGSIGMSWTVVVSPDGGSMSFAVYASVYAPHDVLEFSVDNIPKAVITNPTTSNWQEYEVEMDPGRHVCTWRLIKNVPGLGSSLLNVVDVPDGYQGYVKVDGIKYEDRMRDVITTEAPVTTTTEETTTITTTEEPTTTMAMTTSTIEATTSSTSVETTEAPKETTIDASSVDDDDNETTTSSTTEAPEVVSTTSTTAETPQDSNEKEEANNTSEMSSNTAQADGCPEGLVQVDGLPGCCVEEPNYLGDGACDPWAPYNTEACGYDLGDCCQDTCNEDSPYGCHTKEGAEYGPFGFFCLDPRSASIVIDAEKCLVENREWIGDGGCDGGSEYNTPECGYDGGDCCEGTCDDDYAFYTCGANQPYECLSEDR